MKRCIKCETRIPENSRYCEDCGVMQIDKCLRCGCDGRIGRKFCNMCGSNLQGGSKSGDSKKFTKTKPDSKRFVKPEVEGKKGTTKLVTHEAELAKPETKIDTGSCVYSAALKPGDKYIGTGGADRQVHLWDLESHKCALSLAGHSAAIRCVAFSPDGKLAVSGGDDGKLIKWDTDSERLEIEMAGHSGGVSYVDYSRDGKYAASAGKESTFKVWEMKGGKEILSITEPDMVGAIAFSPDSKYLATGKKNVGVFELKFGKVILNFSGGNGDIGAIAFSRNGKYLAACSREVKIFNMQKGNIYLRIPFDEAEILSAAFSAGGKYLAFGAAGLVKVWNLDDNKEAMSLKAHTGTVSAVGFTDDELSVFSASDDGTIKIWDIK